MKRSYLCIFLCISFIVMAERSHSHSNSQSKIPILKPLIELILPENATGPESLAFSPKLKNPRLGDPGFYTSIADGRILKYDNDTFSDFATTAPNRSKELCDGKSDPSLEPICGRPFGLALNPVTGELYIADAYYGLLVVGPNGGKAKQLATAAEGLPFVSLNALDIDPILRLIYFTDASSVYQSNQIQEAIAARDSTGRLLRYNPITKQVTVLLRNLSLPLGLAVSKDGSYVVFSELINNLTRRLWTRGPQTGILELFAGVSGSPDNVKRNARGEFWVASNSGTVSYSQKLVDDGRQGRVQYIEANYVGIQSPLSLGISEAAAADFYPNGGRNYVGSRISSSVKVFQRRPLL